jgi:ABC-type polysaccharide/polyol phosphate export permease
MHTIHKSLGILAVLAFTCCISAPVIIKSIIIPYPDVLAATLSSYAVFLFVLVPILWKEEQGRDQNLQGEKDL